MRKIIATMWVSLDGFVAGPDDGMGWVRLDEQMMAYEQALVDEAGILMLGRITFGDFAGHWPHLANEPETGDPAGLEAMHRAYARRIDAMRKVVVSRSGSVAEWHGSETLPAITKSDVDRLKRDPGGDILVYGSVSVINALSDLDLVDEYHLLVHPIALGKGKPLFDTPVELELKSIEPFQSGVVLAIYRASTGAVPAP